MSALGKNNETAPIAISFNLDASTRKTIKKKTPADKRPQDFLDVFLAEFADAVNPGRPYEVKRTIFNDEVINAVLNITCAPGVAEKFLSDSNKHFPGLYLYYSGNAKFTDDGQYSIEAGFVEQDFL